MIEHIRTCDCHNSFKCPLANNFLAYKIVYQEEVITEDNNPSNCYLGSSETAFNQSYRNHKTYFNDIISWTDTGLSKLVWDLKSKNFNFEIKWSITKCTLGCNSVTKPFSLCLYEKILICKFQNSSILVNKC